MSANKLIAHTQEILSLSPKGRDCTELAKRYGVCYVSMWKFLKKHGVRFDKETLTEAEQQSLLNDYRDGMRLKELGEKYRVDRNSARNYILRHNEPRLPQFRKSTINHDFFKTLTVDSLWVLGWFYSDGNVSKSSNGFSVTVHSDDEEVLIKIRNAMGIDTDAIYRPKDRKAFLFYGCDDTIHSSLLSLGCMPKKSLIIRYPTQLTDSWHHWAFLRGVVEGDGSFGPKTNGNRPGFTFHIASGSFSFLDEIKSILKSLLDIECKIRVIPKENKIIRGRPARFSEAYQLFILGGKEPIIRLLDLIYENGNAKNYLDRKFKIYLKMKEILKRQPDGASINRHRHRDVYLMDAQQTIYHVNGIRPFAREMGRKDSSFDKLLRGSVSKTGWSLPTPSQISSARASGTLVEKFY